MLETGQVLKDTYYVPVSPDADAPAVIRLAIGIFEFEDPARAAKAAVNASDEDVEPIVGAVPLLPHRWHTLRKSLRPGRTRQLRRATALPATTIARKPASST